jgi:hypothetical protein
MVLECSLVICFVLRITIKSNQDLFRKYRHFEINCRNTENMCHSVSGVTLSKLILLGSCSFGITDKQYNILHVWQAHKETDSQMSEYMGLSDISGGRSVTAEDGSSSRQTAELTIRSQNTLQFVSTSPRHSIGNKPALKIMETSFVNQHQVTPQMDFNPFLQQGDDQVDENSGGSESDDRNSSEDSPLLPHNDSNDQIWTEISLVDSPEESSQTFAKMGSISSRRTDKDYIQYAPLMDDMAHATVQNDLTSKHESSGFTSVLKKPFLPAASFPERTFQQLSPKLLKKTVNISQNASPARPASESGQMLSEPASKPYEEHPLLSENCDGQVTKPGERVAGGHPVRRAKLDSSLSGWISRSTASAEVNGQSQSNLNRRQSLDTLLWGGPTTERVKELLSHGMMMLNISSLTERRASEPRAAPDKVEQDRISAGMLHRHCTFLICCPYISGKDRIMVNHSSCLFPSNFWTI